MIIIEDCRLEDIDLKDKKGTLLIKQKALLIKNRSKLDPDKLNKELANIIKNDKKAIEDLKYTIKNMLINKFGIGVLGYFSREPEIEITNIKYISDKKSIINMYVDFRFHDE